MTNASRVGLILQIEDSDEQYEAMRRAFRDVGLDNPVRRFADGDEALDYLFRRGPYAESATSPRPVLILLDLDLPGTDGREILAQIKADADLAPIPVVILSISDNPHDVRICYRHCAAGYVVIRPGFAGFLETARAIKGYWFEAVVIPGAMDGLGEW